MRVLLIIVLDRFIWNPKGPSAFVQSLLKVYFSSQHNLIRVFLHIYLPCR